MASVLDTELLARVEKPSRYLGTEVNAVVKDPATVDVRLALVFPDLYDIGLGNLGLHILYACVNNLPWAACERGYAPGLDMEAELRKRELPLFALESKDPLSAFDGVGFTLQSELTFTNILNCIDLAGIPLHAEDRGDDDTLVFAGGPAVFNPEPLVAFVDFFVIGDGEDAIVEIAQTLRSYRGRPRAEKLAALAQLAGIYVPALYPFDTLPDGRILPNEDAPKIRKRLTRDLDGATYPVDYIVPFTKQVHDRLNLEVLRGCTQGCRFCQAGMTTRPVRERKLAALDTLLERTLASTGYEEVSLVSLSTCDYSQVRQLVEQTVARARPDHVAVSLPSLRLDSFSVELSDMVAETRKTGITFAPEAASPRLRAIINKWIPDEELLSMSGKVYERGWDLVKLYFMIGLPTERDDDVHAIADLAIKTHTLGRKANPRARVNLGVSTFVPKPFTPFQWAAQIRPEETWRRQEILQERLGRNPWVKFGRHEPEETFLEGLVSRADRRAGALIELAWRKGCRFDAWREHLRFDLWMEAVEELGYDCDDALRERDVDERLPWDHLDMFIPKSWFQEDWKRAMELKHAQDCRHKRCHKCGVIDEERALCASMLRENVEGRKTEKAWMAEHLDADGNLPAKAPREEPPSVQRLWVRVGRTGPSRFLSHLEAMNAWVRSIRRARLPLAYSQGFHPHPKVAFNTAAPVGEASIGDWMDLTLTEVMAPAMVVERLRATIPDGFHAVEAREVPMNAPALMAVSKGATYTIVLPDTDRDTIAAKVAELVGAETILVQRLGKAKSGSRGKPRKVWRDVDVRPMLRELVLRDEEPLTLDVRLVDHESKPGKIKEIVARISADPEMAQILKRDTLLVDPSAWGKLAPAPADDDEEAADEG